MPRGRVAAPEDFGDSLYAYHEEAAVSHLFRSLGDYRFARVVTETPGELCVYEFARGGDSKPR